MTSELAVFSALKGSPEGSQDESLPVVGATDEFFVLFASLVTGPTPGLPAPVQTPLGPMVEHVEVVVTEHKPDPVRDANAFAIRGRAPLMRLQSAAPGPTIAPPRVVPYHVQASAEEAARDPLSEPRPLPHVSEASTTRTRIVGPSMQHSPVADMSDGGDAQPLSVSSHTSVPDAPPHQTQQVPAANLAKVGDAHQPVPMLEQHGRTGAAVAEASATDPPTTSVAEVAPVRQPDAAARRAVDALPPGRDVLSTPAPAVQSARPQASSLNTTSVGMRPEAFSPPVETNMPQGDAPTVEDAMPLTRPLRATHEGSRTATRSGEEPILRVTAADTSATQAAAMRDASGGTTRQVPAEMATAAPTAELATQTASPPALHALSEVSEASAPVKPPATPPARAHAVEEIPAPQIAARPEGEVAVLDRIIRSSAKIDPARHPKATERDQGPAPPLSDRPPLSPAAVEIAGLQSGARGAADAHARVRPVVTVRPVDQLAPVELSAERPQRLTLEVDPPELGRCELELSLHQGRVRATVIADRPETVLALRAVEGQIREQLAARELQVAEFDVRANTQSSLQHGAGQSAFGGGGARRQFAPSAPQTAMHQATNPAPVEPDRTPAHGHTIDLVA